MSFSFLFTRHAAATIDKQMHLADLVENRPWHISLTEGVLSFGGNYHWHIQLLGTEAYDSQTWFWAWTNEANSIPTHSLVASLALKASGEQHGIPDLTTPQLTLDKLDGHALALLASGICDANAYYRCPYDNGALYVLIMDDKYPKCTDPPLQRVSTIFPQAIASLDIPDHDAALCGYLDHYDLEHEHTDNQIIVRGEDGEPVLTATFDDQNRLTNLETSLKASAGVPSGVQDEGAGQPGPNEPLEKMQIRLMLDT